MSTGNSISSFNGIKLTENELSNSYARQCYDPFRTHLSGLNGRPNDIIEDPIGILKKQLLEDWATGWEALMKFDSWSTRYYLSFTKPELSQPVWLLNPT